MSHFFAACRFGVLVCQRRACPRRQAARAGLAACWLALAVPAGAAGLQAPVGFPGLTGLDVSWASGQSARLNGIPAHWAEFSSPHPFLQTARALAQHGTQFQRVLATRQGLVFSGLQDGWHWLAELRPAASGVRGRVSILDVMPGSRGEAPKPAVRPLAGLAPLQGSQSHEFQEDGRRAIHELYSAPMPPGEVTAYVQEHLRRAGWQAEPGFAAGVSMASHWRKQSSRLFVTGAPAGAGSAVFLNYVE